MTNTANGDRTSGGCMTTERDIPRALSVPARRRVLSPHGALALAIVGLAVVSSVAVAQPWRADRQGDEALTLLDRGDYQGARATTGLPRSALRRREVHMARMKLPRAIATTEQIFLRIGLPLVLLFSIYLLGKRAIGGER